MVDGAKVAMPTMWIHACMLCRILGKAGGLRFYSDKQSTSLLFWSFAASCMFAILSIQLPQFDRDNILDPSWGDTQDMWCAPDAWSCFACNQLTEQIPSM